MLSDGRLRGFKVGGQWRFSRREIAKWLQARSQLEVALPPLPPGTIAPSTQALPISCIRAIQEVFAEALDIGTLTIDLDGAPLTEVSNSCDFCRLILSTRAGRRRCAEAWTVAADGEFRRCHAGLLCISAPIEISDRRVAIAAACQFTDEKPDSARSAWEADFQGLAADLRLDEAALRAAAGSARVIPGDHLPRVAHLLRRVADTFSEIGEERLNLLGRLQHIAEVSKV
jgi:ligand-binding sensor protein